MNNDQKIQQLERQVADLMQWKSARERQQLTYPLDNESTKIVQKDLLRYGGDLDFSSTDTNIRAFINSNSVIINVIKNLKPFTAATTDVCTSANHNLANGTLVLLRSTDTLPSPLAENTGYYIISATTDTFKLSLTEGGAAVDITDTGTGTHYLLPLVS